MLSSARFLLPALSAEHPCSAIGEMVGFDVLFTRNPSNRKIQGFNQFLASPVERIETRALAAINTIHLVDDDFRIRENAQHLGIHGKRDLDGFEKCDVLGDIVVVVSNPLGDAELGSAGILDYDSNTGRSRISMGSAVDVSHQFRHFVSSITQCFNIDGCVKRLMWYRNELRIQSDNCGRNCAKPGNYSMDRGKSMNCMELLLRGIPQRQLQLH